MMQNNLMKYNSAVDEYLWSAEQTLESKTSRYVVMFGVNNKKAMFFMVLGTKKIDGVDRKLRNQYTENMNRSKSSKWVFILIIILISS